MPSALLGLYSFPRLQNQHPFIALSLPLPAVFTLATAGSVLPLEDSCGYDNPEWSPGAPSLVFFPSLQARFALSGNKTPTAGDWDVGLFGAITQACRTPCELATQGQGGGHGGWPPDYGQAPPEGMLMHGPCALPAGMGGARSWDVFPWGFLLGSLRPRRRSRESSSWSPLLAGSSPPRWPLSLFLRPSGGVGPSQLSGLVRGRLTLGVDPAPWVHRGLVLLTCVSFPGNGRKGQRGCMCHCPVPPRLPSLSPPLRSFSALTSFSSWTLSRIHLWPGFYFLPLLLK